MSTPQIHVAAIVARGLSSSRSAPSSASGGAIIRRLCENGKDDAARPASSPRTMTAHVRRAGSARRSRRTNLYNVSAAEVRPAIQSSGWSANATPRVLHGERTATCACRYANRLKLKFQNQKSVHIPARQSANANAPTGTAAAPANSIEPRVVARHGWLLEAARKVPASSSTENAAPFCSVAVAAPTHAPASSAAPARPERRYRSQARSAAEQSAAMIGSGRISIELRKCSHDPRSSSVAIGAARPADRWSALRDSTSAPRLSSRQIRIADWSSPSKARTIGASAYQSVGGWCSRKSTNGRCPSTTSHAACRCSISSWSQLEMAQWIASAATTIQNAVPAHDGACTTFAAGSREPSAIGLLPVEVRLKDERRGGNRTASEWSRRLLRSWVPLPSRVD